MPLLSVQLIHPKYKYKMKWFITIIKGKINYIFDEHELMSAEWVRKDM